MTPRLQDIAEGLGDSAVRLGRTVRFMEVCGTHTVSFYRNGLRALVPDNIRLISGPGCPVCVTAQRHIDAAIELARGPRVLIATYGDMLRVPGRSGSLESSRADGADIRVVTSALTAVDIAAECPERTVVFLAVGFETTAPATAAAVITAERRGLENFAVLMCHKRVVPAMRALLDAGETRLDGFLCPGHVSTIIGAEAYRPIVEVYCKPCVVAGFEPAQMLEGLARLVRQASREEARLENVYQAVVSDAGNAVAQRLMCQVFVKADAPWRALGEISASGLELAPAYRRFDAIERFGIALGEDDDNPACRCGEVIQGLVEPGECPLFANGCTPLSPVGPCMVSSEGTCAAWYKYNGQSAGRAAVRIGGGS
ncbi:MAG: hydrogenase formation protein HypD [Planctomycetota bacterium]|nr:MAG: hydrogenase formation protein HypD [Planctomycetota bacterium]